MYHAIVRRQVRGSFESVNRGELHAIVRQFAPDAVHRFAGSHALAGRRDRPEQIREWYDRLGRLLPDLAFTLERVVVSGWPWRTGVAVEWRDSLTDRAGNRHTNRGVHVIELRWGRVTHLSIHCDTVRLTAVLAALAAQGVTEAEAPPIGTLDE